MSLRYRRGTGFSLGPDEPPAGPWRAESIDNVVGLLLDAAGHPSGRPCIVAVDGRSGGGKTTATGARRILGTALLVTAVVGSGVMATTLSPGDVGLQLLENSTATAFALGALILMSGPVSGGHFNPVVSIADWYLGRRSGRDDTGLSGRHLPGYVLAQVAGAIAGSILANLMFALPAVEFSTRARAAAHLWLGEVVATAGLVFLVFALARSGRPAVAPAAVGAYIGAAYWFTSSTSFANPAVTIGRAFTDTFAGIASSSVPAFVGAQLVGLLIAVVLLIVLYPHAGRAADDVVVPHPADSDAAEPARTA